MNKIIRVLTFALLAAGLSAGSSEAKTAKLEIDAETKVVDSLSNAEVNFGVIGKQLTTMENQLKNGNSSSDSLSENVRFLSETRTRISNAKKLYERELEFVQKRIGSSGSSCWWRWAYTEARSARTVQIHSSARAAARHTPAAARPPA